MRNLRIACLVDGIASPITSRAETPSFLPYFVFVASTTRERNIGQLPSEQQCIAVVGILKNVIDKEFSGRIPYDTILTINILVSKVVVSTTSQH